MKETEKLIDEIGPAIATSQGIREVTKLMIKLMADLNERIVQLEVVHYDMPDQHPKIE